MSSKHTAVLTDKAPPPRKVLSQAVVYNDLIFCSGQTGAHPETKKVVDGTVADRAAQCLKNLSAVLEAGGSSLQNVLKVNIFLDSMDNFNAVNEVYEKVFVWDPKPARTCVAAKQLPGGTDVEIECTAYIAGQAKL